MSSTFAKMLVLRSLSKQKAIWLDNEGSDTLI
jgi:hypothetical protein